MGLLGTVVGVMITFAAIAATGEVNISAIAPGLAAALVATVAGLLVAIPALLGYNYLVARLKTVTADLQIFIDEFVTKMPRILQHRLTHPRRYDYVHESRCRGESVRRHQRHADGRSLPRAAAHFHHHDHRRPAGPQGPSAQGKCRDRPGQEEDGFDQRHQQRPDSFRYRACFARRTRAAPRLRQGSKPRHARRHPRRQPGAVPRASWTSSTSARKTTSSKSPSRPNPSRANNRPRS